jgi:putative DNA primase/helicase
VTARQRIEDALTTSGRHVKANGSNAMANCPAHEDTRASLSISERRDGNGVVLYCHAGCETQDIVAALGLTMSDLFDDDLMRAAYNGKATYLYPDGRQVHRKPDKTFPQSGNTKGKALFHADKIGDAVVVYIPEGEKDVLAIEGIGGTAVCSAMGAGKAHLADWSVLAGRFAVIIADKDEPGRKHATQIFELLTGIASSVSVVEAAVGKDAADHIAAGKLLNELVANTPAPVPVPVPAPVASPRQRLDDAHMADYVATTTLADKFCWCRGAGWMSYTGTHWERTSDVTVLDVTRLAVIELHGAEARQGADSDRLKAISGLFSKTRINAIVSLARGVLQADDADFDAHPDLLNVGNGVVDLRTGQLTPHDPALKLTKYTSVHYKPGATHHDWDAALATLPPECADWLCHRFGQAITGHPTPDDILPVLQADGNNGKSTIITPVTRSLGDHAVFVPERVLLANPSDHPTELMSLRGARLAVIEETPEARHLNVKRLKDVLGTDTMTARYISENTVSWHPTHSLVLSTNYRPRVDETDLGTWRRLALVHFPYTYRAPGEPLTSENDRPGDPGLRDRLKVGRDGRYEAVLAWIVSGAIDWYRDGQILPAMPDRIRADTRTWRTESDLVLGFITEYMVRDTDWHVMSTDLHIAFNGWLKARGHREWSDQTFSGRLKEHEEWRGIEHRQMLASKVGLSRPTWAVGVPHNRFWSWCGVRFRNFWDESKIEDELAISGKNVTNARGARGRQEVESLKLYEAPSECPVHPVQSLRSTVCCPCGRPAPVSKESGLCSWCEIKVSKQQETPI